MGSAGPLRYDDVPWPPKMTAMLRAACSDGDGGEGGLEVGVPSIDSAVAPG